MRFKFFGTPIMGPEPTTRYLAKITPLFIFLTVRGKKGGVAQPRCTQSMLDLTHMAQNSHTRAHAP